MSATNSTLPPKAPSNQAPQKARTNGAKYRSYSCLYRTRRYFY